MSVRAFCKFGIAIGLANYALYALALHLAGGDALYGRIVDGHYLIQAGGRFVEISRALFLFGRWDGYALLATFPLGLLCASLLPGLRGQENGAQTASSWSAATPHNGR